MIHLFQRLAIHLVLEAPIPCTTILRPVCALLEYYRALFTHFLLYLLFFHFNSFQILLQALDLLLIVAFLLIDWTGELAFGLFKVSPTTDTGALSSRTQLDALLSEELLQVIQLLGCGIIIFLPLLINSGHAVPSHELTLVEGKMPLRVGWRLLMWGEGRLLLLRLRRLLEPRDVPWGRHFTIVVRWSNLL